jgi:hypothetical protein
MVFAFAFARNTMTHFVIHWWNPSGGLEAAQGELSALRATSAAAGEAQWTTTEQIATLKKQLEAARAGAVGPDGYCSPRHKMPRTRNTGANRPISVYRFPLRALTLCPQLCMGIQPDARSPARSADALPATLYGHFNQAMYRNRPIAC